MITDDFDTLPNAMRNAKRWLLWKSEPNQDPTKKPRKVPYYANGSRRAGELDSPADIANLATFDEALNATNFGQFIGLGFALGSDGTGNYWQGVDIDNLPDHPELAYIVDELPGYTEQSPSGKGMHAIGYGQPFKSMGSNASGIEAYSSGRYFTVTADGAGIHPPVCLADFVESRLRPMHSIKASTTQSSESPEYCEIVTDQTVTELRSALNFMRADDRELWQRNGHRLKCLGEVGRGLWLDWSATSDKFDPHADSKSWESFKPTHTSYKAIFKEAHIMGWVNPASNAANSQNMHQNRIIDDFNGEADNGFSFNRVSLADVFTCPPEPQRYVWGERIPHDELTLLAAHGGTGKSTFALQLAVHAATDSPFLGLQTGDHK